MNEATPNQIVPPQSLTSPHFNQMLEACIHCGLCLQACPTYSVLGTETDAPRGRINLMRAASEGRIVLDGPFKQHIDLCLGCRACETACPSGVQYGALLETTRASLQDQQKPGFAERFIRWLALRQMLPHLNRLRWTARLLRVYQASGMQRVVRAAGLLPERLKLMDGLLPELPRRYAGYHRPALAIGQKHGSVAFFYGCVQEAFLAGVNEATVRVLQRNGYEVHFPFHQTCCGAAQLHVGEEELARRLARQNIDAFLDSQTGTLHFEAIVNNAGGCGATLKDYPHLLKDDPDYAFKAQKFSSQVQDISEFLANHLHTPPTGEVRRRVTYSDSCHLRHAQKVVNQPRELLKMIPGLELVELSQPERCCGSAGVYNIIHTDTSNAILDEKMDDIRATGADTIVATNTGCQLQLIYGVQRSGFPAEVVHLIELIDRSYQNGDPEKRIAGVRSEQNSGKAEE